MQGWEGLQPFPPAAISASTLVSVILDYIVLLNTLQVFFAEIFLRNLEIWGSRVKPGMTQGY